MAVDSDHTNTHDGAQESHHCTKLHDGNEVCFNAVKDAHNVTDVHMENGTNDFNNEHSSNIHEGSQGELSCNATGVFGEPGDDSDRVNFTHDATKDESGSHDIHEEPGVWEDHKEEHTDNAEHNHAQHTGNDGMDDYDRQGEHTNDDVSDVKEQNGAVDTTKIDDKTFEDDGSFRHHGPSTSDGDAAFHETDDHKSNFNEHTDAGVYDLHEETSDHDDAALHIDGNALEHGQGYFNAFPHVDSKDMMPYEKRDLPVGLTNSPSVANTMASSAAPALDKQALEAIDAKVLEIEHLPEHKHFSPDTATTVPTITPALTAQINPTLAPYITLAFNMMWLLGLLVLVFCYWAMLFCRQRRSRHTAKARRMDMSQLRDAAYSDKA